MRSLASEVHGPTRSTPSPDARGDTEMDTPTRGTATWADAHRHPTDAALDHVAVAVERWADAWPRYAVELGGAWSSGGFNVGFGPAQLRFANGARVEILQPWEPEENPFLRRFLDRHGPSPHHLTFKVPDLASAIDQAPPRRIHAGGCAT